MLVAKKESYDYYEKPSTTKSNKVIVTKRKKENNVALKIKAFIYAFAMLAICLTVLFRYTYITKEQIEISQLNNEISRLTEEKQELEIELDKLKDSRWIEVQAISKLDMKYPSNMEKKYVTVDNSIWSKIEMERDAATNTKEKRIFMDSFKNLIVRIANAI